MTLRYLTSWAAVVACAIALVACNQPRPEDEAPPCPPFTIEACSCGTLSGARSCVDGAWTACACSETLRPSRCGDGVCAADESPEGCPADCATCGDGACDPTETAASCPEDCGSEGTCGDGTCDPDETEFSCPEDCLSAPVCGDGECESFENAVTCPEDCLEDTCGDGICGESESGLNCPEDCGSLACGDGICEPPENERNCPQDCDTALCGDGICEPPETRESCGLDCGELRCGDGWCDGGEDCPSDCDGGTCGDGTCDLYETPFDCRSDCDNETCGDGICDASEHAYWCQDCAPDACGNGQIDLFEGAALCPEDLDASACDPANADVFLALGDPGGRFPLLWDRTDGATSTVEAGWTLALEAPPTSLNVTLSQGRLPIYFGPVATERGLLEPEDVAAFLVYSGFSAPSLVLPNAEVTLETPTCLRIRPVTSGDQLGTEAEVRVAVRWDDPGRQVAIDAIRIGGADISNSQIRAAIERASESWSENGAPELVLEQIIDIEGPAAGPLEGVAIAEMRARALGATDAVNLYIYESIDSELGVLGFAGGIPGAPFDGYASSGVVVQVDGHRSFFGGNLDSTLLGDTIAHELGHQLGLFHTSESSGDFHDPIEDTPECPPERDTNEDGFVDSFECEDLDGTFLMFWLALERVAAAPVSAMQSDVLIRHPVTR